MRTIRSVEKAFQILDCIAEGDGRRSMAQIGRELGMPPATLHGFLQTLEGLGVVVRDPYAGGYAIGERMLRLGLKGDSSTTLARLVRPHLVDLRNTTRETVHLAVPVNGDEVRYVGMAEGSYPVRLTSLVGRTERAEDTALGPVLFTSLATDHPRGVVCGRRGGRGYCMKQEADLDAVCVAASFSYGTNGASRAGISVVIPRFRFAARGEDFYVDPLVRTAEEVERELGGVDPAEGSPDPGARRPGS